MATRKITLKATVKRTVKRTLQFEQRMQVNRIPLNPSISPPASQSSPSSTTQKALNDFTHQAQPLQKKLEIVSRRRSIPSGIYTQPIETLFYALDKQRKPEESEAASMYDVFISHASEDKADFVNPLVEKLQDAGIRVWIDTLEMQWGKSLREQIDNGIKRSKFAILVLSKHFFAKKWPQRELDGILAKESMTGQSPLPIWHNITQEELYEFSPTLTGIYAYSSQDYSIDSICKALQLLLEEEAR